MQPFDDRTPEELDQRNAPAIAFLHQATGQGKASFDTIAMETQSMEEAQVIANVRQRLLALEREEGRGKRSPRTTPLSRCSENIIRQSRQHHEEYARDISPARAKELAESTEPARGGGDTAPARRQFSFCVQCHTTEWHKPNSNAKEPNRRIYDTDSYSTQLTTRSTEACPTIA